MATPIRGETRPIPVKAGLMETQKLNANINASIHNRFDVEVIDSKTGKIKQRAQAENVICSSLWTRLLAPNTYFNYIHYGTGSGTPAATDTSLFTFLAAVAPTASNNVVTTYPKDRYASNRKKIQLSETDNVGAILTEVGIGYSNTSATLVTHAMLQDMNGNQISIEKTNTDVINIYATVFVHWGTGYDSDHIFVLPTSGVQAAYSPGEYQARFFLGFLLGDYVDGDYSYARPPVKFQMAKGYYGSASYYSPFLTSWIALTPSYSVANKQITLTATRIPAASANATTGARYIMASSKAATQEGNMDLLLEVGGSWYTGSSITAEAIGTGDGSTLAFATAFDLPESVTVYLDGVAQTSGVTIIKDPIKYNDMGQYFIFLDPSSTDADHVPGVQGVTPFINSYGDIAETSQSQFIYYNPLYDVGIASFRCGTESKVYFAVSNDLSSWTVLGTLSSTTTVFSVPSAYQHYKYWKIYPASGTFSSSFTYMTAPSEYVGKPIVFSTAPSSGTVITADYTTPTIAKDANHVFDLSIVITLGEYTS